MALPGIFFLSQTERQLLVEYGGNNTLLFWLVCLRVKIRGYLGPPTHSVAPMELRRSHPRNGVDIQVQLKRHVKSTTALTGK